METNELLNVLNNDDKFRLDERPEDIDIEACMKHPEVEGGPDNVPDWFDFDEWYDTTPSPGFHNGKILVVENAENNNEEDEIVALGPDDSSTWRK